MGRKDTWQDYSGGCFEDLNTPGELLEALEGKETPGMHLTEKH